MAERDPSCSLQCHCARLWFAQGFGQCLGTFPWNAGWRSISAPISGDPDERIGRWWSDDLMVQLFRMRTSIMMNMMMMMMMTMTMMIHHDAAAVVVCSSYSTYRDHKKNPVQRVVLQMRCFTARCLTTPSRTTPSWRPAWNVEMWPPLRRAHGETCWIVWLEGVGIWWQSDGSLMAYESTEIWDILGPNPTILTCAAADPILAEGFPKCLNAGDLGPNGPDGVWYRAGPHQRPCSKCRGKSWRPLGDWSRCMHAFYPR